MIYTLNNEQIKFTNICRSLLVIRKKNKNVKSFKIIVLNSYLERQILKKIKTCLLLKILPGKSLKIKSFRIKYLGRYLVYIVKIKFIFYLNYRI